MLQSRLTSYNITFLISTKTTKVRQTPVVSDHKDNNYTDRWRHLPVNDKEPPKELIEVGESGSERVSHAEVLQHPGQGDNGASSA